jgi:hypothetical protein
MTSSDPKREMLRHGLATLAYRGGKAVRDTPSGFEDFRGSPSSRSAGELLGHIGDLLDWALSIARGKQRWNNAKPLPWDEEVIRFFAALKALDDYLASADPLHAAPEKLLQGPVADALTHVGQIVMLRRMAGGPMKSESYFAAEIVAGRLGPDQTPPKQEFD